MDKHARRTQLLELARHLFAKKGYHATNVEDIVSAADVARGTFYLYFADKRAIFEELVSLSLVRIGTAIERVDVADPARSVESQVLANIQRIVHALLEDPDTTKILLSAAVGVDEDFDRRLIGFYEEVGKLLEESLTDGQALGIVASGDARMLSILTLGALKELLYQIVMRGLPYDANAVTAALYAFLKNGVLRV
ncbi:MAG: TetR/AcrR family transcriptional regulator [Polyangiaceae bacterium]